MQAMFETISLISTTSHHIDIDECALGISGCNQNCTNTNGSYFCSCYVGYQISSNYRTCVGKRTYHCSIYIYIIICYWWTTSHHTDIHDECALGISGCNQNCTNTIESYVCSCYLGYQISSNNRTCVGKTYISDTTVLTIYTILMHNVSPHRH